jgi:hypothetical protein
MNTNSSSDNILDFLNSIREGMQINMDRERRGSSNQDVDFEMVYKRQYKSYTIDIQNSNERVFIENELSKMEHVASFPMIKENNEAEGILKLYIDFLKEKKEVLKNDASKRDGPVIGFFCWLIYKTEIMKKGAFESVDDYCKRVCEKYRLRYRAKLRQYFHGEQSGKRKDRLETELLPEIDEDTRNQLIKYLTKENKDNKKNA